MNFEKIKNAEILTYLGLAPFIAFSLLDLFNIAIFEIDSARILSYYAALIFSFISGVYFGSAISQVNKNDKVNNFYDKLLIFSVFLQIYAWLVLSIFENYNLIKIFLIIGFLILTIIETYFFNKFINSDFLKMRCKATTLVIIFLSLSIDNTVYKCTASEKFPEKIIFKQS